MPAYNIAANQRLARPVSAHLEGRARRLANDLNAEELEARPALRQRQEEAAVREQEKHDRAFSDADAKRFVSWLQLAAPALRNDDYETAAMAAEQLDMDPPPLEMMPKIKALLPELQPETKVVGKNDALITTTGVELYKNEGGEDEDNWTSPQKGERDGESVFFQTNKATGEVRVVGADEGVAPQSDGESQSQRQDKIDSLVNQGISKTDAEAMVDGFLEMKYSEATGQILLTDLRTQEAREILPEQLPRPDRALPQEGHTLYDMARLATGPESAFKSAAAVPLAWFDVEHDSRVVYARQALKTATREFVQTMSLNPRYPMGEQDLIRQEIAALPQFLDSPSLMQDRMRSLGDSLRFRLSKVKEDSRNTSLTADHRKEARKAVATIENFLDLLGAPSGMSAETESGLDPERDARLKELREKQAEGTLDAPD